jgi:NAD+ diphosphatase
VGLAPERTLYLGTYREEHCFVAELPADSPVPEGFERQGLRALFGAVEEPLAALAGRAFQLMEWDRNHHYCGRCGTPTTVRTDERSRQCPGCSLTSYPPVAPAVMVLVTDGRRMLLARKPMWPEGRYSAIAGFVEPGETLEDTVRRETLEEVGVEVGRLRYFASQPWPFPHSLMVAFIAEHAGGEVRPDGVEIVEAGWFGPDQLPKLPPRISIARRLIEAVAAELRVR